MSTLTKLILETFDLPRCNLIREWKDDEEKPYTEGSYLGKQDGSDYEEVIHSERGLKNISTKVVWAPKNITDQRKNSVNDGNVYYSMISLFQPKSSCVAVLLFAPFLHFEDISHAINHLFTLAKKKRN